MRKFNIFALNNSGYYHIIDWIKSDFIHGKVYGKCELFEDKGTAFTKAEFGDQNKPIDCEIYTYKRPPSQQEIDTGRATIVLRDYHNMEAEKVLQGSVRFHDEPKVWLDFAKIYYDGPCTCIGYNYWQYPEHRGYIQEKLKLKNPIYTKEQCPDNEKYKLLDKNKMYLLTMFDDINRYCDSLFRIKVEI